MKKRIFSTLLALCMLLCLMPTAAFAEGSTETPPVCSCETACTAENMNKECPVCGAENAIPQNCGQYIPVEDRTGENSSTEGADDPNGPTELSAADQVQAMINALPSAEAITEDNTEEVKAQLEAIDEAKAQLSDEELEQLDFSLYTEAASALGGLAKPMLTDSTKKISVRMNAKNGKYTDSVSDGVSTAYGTTHTLTVTPQTGRYVIAGYFAGTDYYKTNPAKYQYSNMTLDKISEADPQTGAVQYQFTATEVIPISNDPNYDYICLYFHCAKLPTLLWPFGNISGEATVPSTDGNTAAIPYVSQKELCGDPDEYTGYYSLADKKDRPYLDWQVISITDKEGNKAGGTVAFDNNHLTYTPTADEAGKTVTITIRPKLGYVEEANTPLSFEIEVKKPVVEQSEFNVTMVTDGYGNAVAMPNSAKEGEEIQLTAIPDRGHHFKEWQATPGNIMITNDKFTMPAENVTVKAIFEANTYTVNLDANGGTIASGQDVTSYTYGVGATLPTADDMTYTGHTFNGWYEDSDFSGNPVTTISATDTGNKTYYAKWEVNTYTVTLNANGGTINSGNVTSYTYGVDTTLPTAGDMTYTGHTFKGWYDNENLTGSPVTAIGGTETGNKEYWAKWEINQYTVTFDTAGGSAVASITQDYGTSIAAPADPTREGYTFIGWDKEIPSTMPAENVTVTAKWVVNQYTITFDTAGGSAVASITQDYGTAIAAPADPTREGYTFIGWDKAIPTTMPAENMIITANWKVNQYTITFDSNGGSEIAPITQDYGTAITAPADPTREGYTFIGWDKAIPATMPAENMIITAQWRDIAVPTGEIKIAENGWKSFLNTITFRLFFKDTQTVTVTAADNSGKAVTVEYLLSDKALTESELAGKTFTAYSAPFSINADNEYVIYAKLTDTSGNFAYINTNGIVLDATVPVISGIADGKTYCAAQTVTVTEKYISTVKVNGTEVSLDKNSQFALSPASGEQTIVVTDKAGNETKVTVTVNNGHTYEWQSENGQYWQKCKFCNHETAKKDIPTINISGADKVCRTQDYKFSFTLPEGATGAAYGYEFIGLGGGPLTPTVENGLYSGIIKASTYPAKENSFKLIVSAKTADGFAFSAEKKVAIQNEHSGGTATCKDKAICEVCGESYGKLDPNNHANLKHIDAKAATKTSEGNIEYWYCDGCNKYYKDAKATQEITKAQTVTAKLPPRITAGDGATVTQGEKKELSFTSDASFADFLRVELDGTTLDEKNYTKREGSTIITLNRDFVATLSVGEHTLAIVSQSGTATAKFTVKAKPAETATPQPTVTPQPTAQPQPTVQPVSPLPRTGDTANPALWFALLIVSGSALAAIFVLRRKDNRK